MEFNPPNKAISLIGDIDFLLFGDSSTLNTRYSITDRTRNINLAWDEAVSELYKADPNHKWDDTTNTDFPIATTDLTANLDHYVMLDSALVVHRVRMKDAQGNWITLTSRLRSELTDNELNATGTPDKYFKFAGAIFPLPVPTYGVGDGVELEFQRGGNYFVIGDTTAAPGFNKQFHPFLSVSAALRYAIANGMSEKKSFLKEEKEEIRISMVEHYQMRSPDDRPNLRLKKPNRRQYGL